MTTIKIFFHVATINNYQEIVDELLDKIFFSGLYNKIEKLYLGVVGDKSVNHNFKKIVKFKDNDIKKGEFFTLNCLYNQAINDPLFNALYIHTKGVTFPENECIKDWRKYMAYFNIQQYKMCLESLKTYDTCGVDFVDTPVKHYSGNFWWARSDYIARLKPLESLPIILTPRHKAEFWIGSGQGNHKSLWNSGINVFERHLHQYAIGNYKQ